MPKVQFVTLWSSSFVFLTFRIVFVGSLSCIWSLHFGNTASLATRGADSLVIFLSLHFLLFSHLSGSATWQRYMVSLKQISLQNQFHVYKKSYFFSLGCCALPILVIVFDHYLQENQVQLLVVSPITFLSTIKKRCGRLEDLTFGVVKAIHSFLSRTSWYLFCRTTLRKITKSKWQTGALS